MAVVAICDAITDAADIRSIEQVPGSLGGWIYYVEQVPGSFWAGFVTLNRYQDRSGAGFVRWNGYRIALGPDL